MKTIHYKVASHGHASQGSISDLVARESTTARAPVAKWTHPLPPPYT
jgi:hypothetical protein